MQRVHKPIVAVFKADRELEENCLKAERLSARSDPWQDTLVTGSWRNSGSEDMPMELYIPIVDGDDQEELRPGSSTEVLKHFMCTLQLRHSRVGEAGLTWLGLAISFEDSCGMIV